MRPLGHLSSKLVVLLLCPLLTVAVFSRSGTSRTSVEETPAEDPAVQEESPPMDEPMAMDSTGGLLLDSLGHRRVPEEKIPETNPVQRWAVISFFAVGVGVLVYLMVPKLSAMVQKG